MAKRSKLSILLSKYGACSWGRRWAMKHKTPAKAWAACNNWSMMCWALNRIYEDRNARRGVVCKLIREMELPNGKTMWKLLTREGRKAVVVAEKMVAGKTVANVREVEIAALGACVDSLEDKYGARCAARWLVGVYPDWATDYIFCAYRFNSANPYDDDKNNAAVCEAVRKVLGNPFIKRKKKAVT